MSGRPVIVIGGGLAGLAAATALAERGVTVTVIEGRQQLGGRAFSFRDPATGDVVDNGQHLLMSCYHEVRRFLRRIGSEDLVTFQPRLEVPFAGPNGRRARLKCPAWPAPLHAVVGLLGLSTLSWADRLRLRHLRHSLETSSPEDLDRLTVEQWLTRCHQSPQAQRHLWEPITLATVNELPSLASAFPFVQVLRQALLASEPDSHLGWSRVGLTDLYVPQSRQFVESRGGVVLLQSPVDQVELGPDRISGLRLRDGRRLEAGSVICAVPPAALQRLLPASCREAEPALTHLADWTSSPIISVHLWFDHELTPEPLVGLLDTTVQWLFNRSRIHDGAASTGYVSLVISGAHAMRDWPESKIVTLAQEELRLLFPDATPGRLQRSRVIKEHAATPSLRPGMQAWRPQARTAVPGLYLAGDWTDTGIPATLEGAVLSGHRAAEAVTAQKEAAHV